MNSGCVVAPEPWGETRNFGLPNISRLSEQQALDLTMQIIGFWHDKCREKVGIPPHLMQFTPWHHEARFVREAMIEAATGDLVRSIVMGFNRKCREYNT